VFPFHILKTLVKPKDGGVTGFGLAKNPFSRFPFVKVEFGLGEIDECVTQRQVGPQKLVTVQFAFGYELGEGGVVHRGILTAGQLLVQGRTFPQLFPRLQEFLNHPPEKATEPHTGRRCEWPGSRS
jgi:hypothetical protein